MSLSWSLVGESGTSSERLTGLDASGAVLLPLQSLQPHLARIASTPSPELATSKSTGAAGGKGALAGMASSVDDRLYAFEAVGLLVGQVSDSTPPGGVKGLEQVPCGGLDIMRGRQAVCL